MPRAALAAVLALLLLIPLAGLESRSVPLDVVVLLDTSLSMAGPMQAAAEFVAAEVVEGLLAPGDRLIVELFYGRIDRLYGGTIGSAEDKARVAAALRAVQGRGRFTNIGMALDHAKADLAELGGSGRLTWVLLVTDERQEVAYGTAWYSPDFVARHPALERARRIDQGPFRAITVDFGLKGKVEKVLPSVLSHLEGGAPRSGDERSDLP